MVELQRNISHARSRCETGLLQNLLQTLKPKVLSSMSPRFPTCVCAKSLSRVQLCNPMSLPGSFVRGILQARILEWVVVPFSRDQTWVFSYVSCNGRWFLTTSATLTLFPTCLSSNPPPPTPSPLPLSFFPFLLLFLILHVPCNCSFGHSNIFTEDWFSEQFVRC